MAEDDSWPVRSQAAVAMAHFARRQPSLLLGTQAPRAMDRQSEGSVSYFVHRNVVSRAMLAVHDAPGGPEPDFATL